MSETAERCSISDDYVAAFRGYLRIATDRLDGEIEDLIHAARGDLVLGGVLPARAIDESDPLIKRAIATYIKAEFGLDNDNAEQYRAAYGELKKRFLLSDWYTEAEEV